jgi:hypothetical protein
MSQLKLQKRDDPLAITTATPTAEKDETGETAPAATTPKRPPAARRRALRTKPSTSSAPDQRTYDQDRLDQTGWRIYESLLAEVRQCAEELSAAGIPTSAAALASATLHTHLPRTPEDGAEIMRIYRQATAGRQRARRTA